MDDASVKRVRDELERVAREGQPITYKELGRRVGKHWRNLRPELDRICEDENAAGRPDLTLVVQKSGTGLPGMFEGKPMTPDARERYEQRLQEVFDYHRGR